MSESRYAVIRVLHDRGKESRVFAGFANTFEAVCRRVLNLYEGNDRRPVEVEVFKRIEFDGEANDAGDIEVGTVT